MRVNKLTFLESRIRNQSIDQNYITIIGVLSVIFYILMIVFPYYSSYCKGKIGINTLDNKKYNLISTALRYVNQPIQYFIMIIALIFTTILLYNKGFFKRVDKRLIVPISLYGNFIIIFLLTKIFPEKFIVHNIMGVVFFIISLLLVFFINSSYSNYFVDSDLGEIHILKNVIFIFGLLGLILGIFNIYNNYIRKIKLWPKYIPTVRNLLGFFELGVFIIVSISFGIMISYPPLPETKPELTCF